jgi:hypothetical protein
MRFEDRTYETQLAKAEWLLEHAARWNDRDPKFADLLRMKARLMTAFCTPIRDSLRAIGRPGAGGASIEFVSRSTPAEQAPNPGSRGSNSPRSANESRTLRILRKNDAKLPHLRGFRAI